MAEQETPATGPIEPTVRPLRPYMCYCGDAADGAVLAWAHTAQDARKLAYPAIADWTDCGFINVRARLLKAHPAYYETLKLKDAPHVNDDPPVCPVCELWGHPPLPNGQGCEFCGVDDGALTPALTRPRKRSCSGSPCSAQLCSARVAHKPRNGNDNQVPAVPHDAVD